MNTKLITEIKKNAFIVVLDEADTSEQEIEKLFNYAESKNYRIFFHHGIKTEKVFVLFNPTLKHVEVLPYEPVIRPAVFFRHVRIRLGMEGTGLDNIVNGGEKQKFAVIS